MYRPISLLASLVVPVFMLAVANPAIAQDKAKAEKGKVTIKVLHEDDKVRVVEATFKPGDQGPNVARAFRVVRPLKGGTLERTWADGKKDKLEFKTGEVQVLQASTPYTPKNVGKSDVVLYVVFVKEPKK